MIFFVPLLLCTRSEKGKNGETGRKKYSEKQRQLRDESSSVDVTII